METKKTSEAEKSRFVWFQSDLFLNIDHILSMEFKNNSLVIKMDNGETHEISPAVNTTEFKKQLMEMLG